MKVKVIELYFFQKKYFFSIFFYFLEGFEKKIGNSEKIILLFKESPRPPGAIFEWFGIFPHLLGTLGGVEKCQTIQKLHLVVWDFLCVIFFLKLDF